jgi:hypothetical protein
VGVIEIAVILVIVATLVLAAVFAFSLYRRKRIRRTEQLRDQFGQEYDYAISRSGRGDGERELARRTERVQNLSIRDLTPEERRTYSAQWRDVQAKFVEFPELAIHDADALVQEVMAARGYPMGDFEQRAADLSVLHSEVIRRYRQGHDVSEQHKRTPQSTEELRQAMVHYRAVYAELLGEATSISVN